MTNSAPLPRTAAPINPKWNDLPTSWDAEGGVRWNTFRTAVKSGTSADRAADIAGIERIPAAPKTEFEW